MKKVTIKDIAKIANVNHSTVSRSLNDNPMIPETTRNRIKKIANDLNFVFNTNARGLNTRKTDSIGLIFTEGFDYVGASSYFMTMLHRIRQNLHEKNFDTIIDLPKNIRTGKSNIHKLIQSQKIDGLIIADSRITQEEIEYIKENEIPFVLLHFKLDFFDKCAVDYFCSNNVKGAFLATEHLMKQGHKELITITLFETDKIFYEFKDRTNGFLSAIEQSGIENIKNSVYGCQISFEGAYELVKEKLAEIKKASAIFVQTDLMAFGVIRALHENGIKVPDDIAIIGYDDIPYAKYHLPSLSTVHQPVNELADNACNVLLEKLEIKNNTNGNHYIEIPPKLVIRESSGLITT